MSRPRREQNNDSLQAPDSLRSIATSRCHCQDLGKGHFAEPKTGPHEMVPLGTEDAGSHVSSCKLRTAGHCEPRLPGRRPLHTMRTNMLALWVGWLLGHLSPLRQPVPPLGRDRVNSVSLASISVASRLRFMMNFVGGWSCQALWRLLMSFSSKRPGGGLVTISFPAGAGSHQARSL